MRLLRTLKRIFWNPLPKHVDPPDMSVLPPPPYPSLSLALDLAKQAVEHQSDTADALDTKAGFVLASASLLVAVLTVWHAPSDTIPCAWSICSERLVPHMLIRQSLDIVAWLILVGAILIYGLVIYFAGRAYHLREFSNPPQPAKFVTPYDIPGYDLPGYTLLLPEAVAKLSVFQDVLQAHADNANLIEEKVQWLRRALITFWIEAGVVGIVLIYETMIASHMG